MKISLRIVVYLVLLALVIMLMMMLKNCSGRKDAAEIVVKNDSVLNVSIEFTPMSYYMEGDSLGGFNYELLKLIEKRSGKRIVLYPNVNLQKSIDALEKGEYDILAQNVPVTSDDKERFLYSDPIMLDRQVLVQRYDSAHNVKVNNQIDLAKKTLNVVKGSPTIRRIRNMSDEIGDTIYIKEEPEYGPEVLFIMVATGDIDYAVVSESIAKKMAADYPNVSIATDISFTQFHAWIVNGKNKQLLDSLNLWLSDVKKMPEYKKIYSRYIKE